MSDADRVGVIAANAAFYRAFEALDLGAMEALWPGASHQTTLTTTSAGSRSRKAARACSRYW